MDNSNDTQIDDKLMHKSKDPFDEPFINPYASSIEKPFINQLDNSIKESTKKYIKVNRGKYCDIIKDKLDEKKTCTVNVDMVNVDTLNVDIENDKQYKKIPCIGYNNINTFVVKLHKDSKYVNGLNEDYFENNSDTTNDSPTHITKKKHCNYTSFYRSISSEDFVDDESSDKTNESPMYITPIIKISIGNNTDKSKSEDDIIVEVDSNKKKEHPTKSLTCVKKTKCNVYDILNYTDFRKALSEDIYCGDESQNNNCDITLNNYDATSGDDYPPFGSQYDSKYDNNSLSHTKSIVDDEYYNAELNDNEYYDYRFYNGLIDDNVIDYYGDNQLMSGGYYYKMRNEMISNYMLPDDEYLDDEYLNDDLDDE